MSKAKEENSENLIPFTKSQLPIVDFEFSAIKKALTDELAKYKDVVVTSETLKDDKKLAQELNAKGKGFNKLRIEKIKEISKPIDVFKSQMDELVTICNESSEIIKRQVKVFEDARLESLTILLSDTIAKLREESEVDPTYFSHNVELSLVKLGSLTPKDALTKGALDSLKSMVSDECALQQTVNYRLLQLEAESFKAGLTVPLLRLNVESFLYSSDEVYKEKLLEVVSSELSRQKEAERISSQNENYNQGAGSEHSSEGVVIEVTSDHQENIPLPEYDEYQSGHYHNDSDIINNQPLPQIEEGNVAIAVVTTFNVEVDSRVTDEMISSKITQMIADAGITSLTSIQVIRNA